jgi:protein-disulfide isomerase
MSSVGSDEEDLTRKQRREQARAERKALEEAEAAKAVRRTRLTQLGIVTTIVVVAIVVVAVAAGGGGKSAPPKEGSKTQTEAVAAVNSTIGGIPQSGNTLGSPTAPVTLVYFGDLECPICKDFTKGALPSIIQQWVRSGKLRIEYRSLETASREPEVFKSQQIAALAAGKQNKGWNYIELFYHEQGEENSGYVTESYMQGLARQIPGLSFATWTSARSNPELANQIAADAQLANNQGFTGTPSFMIGRTGGTLKKLEYTSLTDPTSFNQAIESLLKG